VIEAKNSANGGQIRSTNRNTYLRGFDYYTAEYLMFLVVSVLIMLNLLSIGFYSVYGASNPGMFLKGSMPYGVPYEEWLARWWEWNLQIPTQKHPISNASITKCPVGESVGGSGAVSFLTQKLQGKSAYSCIIPAQHAILVPIGTGECTNDEAKSSLPEKMIKCATEGDKYITFDSNIDGERLLVKPNIDPNLDEGNNYAITKPFNITIPEDNFLNLTPGQWKAGAGGYFIFLKPLPAGQHTLSINAKVTNPIDRTYDFNYNTIYSLTVQ
jgi:hypothetical protein